MKIGVFGVIILTAGILLLSGCTGGVGSTGYNQETTCPNISLSQGVELKQNEFDKTGALYSARHFIDKLNLPDGWQIDDDKPILGTISCKKGSKEGQNANYWYCEPIFLKKLETSPDGEIIGTQKLSVAPILKREAGAVEAVSLTCYKPK